MSLQINWNMLYSAQLKKREEVEERILDYCIREGLYEQGVTIADVTNMGWHGESGSADLGGHITICFLREDGRCVTMGHIYCTDEAYAS
ncbi:hypothetical protein EI94DRAFT_1815143 [Lactarius quietus]|nr:hypothetical protein EI94DRAFT_1815143 [Lactarius quietus]